MTSIWPCEQRIELEPATSVFLGKTAGIENWKAPWALVSARH
jgi:hypothetical protein